MALIYILALAYVAFVIFVLAALSGWLVNILYAFKVILGALFDLACQGWLDIRKLWGKKIRLDEHERHLS